MMHRTAVRFARLPCRVPVVPRFSTVASSHMQSASHSDFAVDPVFVVTSPGSRLVELRRPHGGNVLDTETTAMVSTHIANLGANSVVQALLFTSEDPDMFSLTMGAPGGRDMLEGMHAMAVAVADSEKETVVMYGGALTGTAFSAFAGAKHRLGSNVVSFRLAELAQGQLPLCGTAFHFAGSGAYHGDGAAMARYLAVTGRAVRADQLYSMGLLTHLVEEGAHDSLMQALAHTNPSSEDLGEMANQDAPTRAQSVAGLLDTMHIEEDLDVLSHKVWNDFVLVPPGRWDTEQVQAARAAGDVEDLEEIEEQIAAVFTGDDVAAVQAALKAVDAPWAAEAASHMAALDVALVQQWWDLTATARDTKSLQAVLQMEGDLL